MTRFTHELLSRREIIHWLDFGTLLGAVRNQAFIPWDDDVDFGILGADVPAILESGPEIETAGYALEVHPNGKVIRINYSAVNTLHVDLFFWKERDGVLFSDLHPKWFWPGSHDRVPFARRYVERLETVQLFETPFPAPSPVHQFLVDHRYGPEYMVPLRPIMSTWLYPPIASSEMTPRVRGMLQSIAEKDSHLSDLETRSPLSRTRLWRSWRRLALPPPPSQQAPARLDGIPPDERTEAIEQLARSIAWLDLAIEEIENPSLGSRARRFGRRVLEALREILRRVARR